MKSGASSRTAALQCHRITDETSALLDAIQFVATAAVLSQRAHGSLEAVEILHRGVRSLRVFAELDELGFEIGHVFPDLRRRCGLATGLGVRWEQSRHLGRGLFKGRER